MTVLIEYLHSHIGTEKMESYREKLQMKQETVEEAVLKRTIARRNKVGIIYHIDSIAIAT